MQGPGAPDASGEAMQDVDGVEEALVSCSSNEEAPVVVYVAKMVAVPVGQIPRRPGDPAPANALEECFLAFGRVFSGTIKDGQQLFVLPGNYDPGNPDPYPVGVQVSNPAKVPNSHGYSFLLPPRLVGVCCTSSTMSNTLTILFENHT